MSKRADLTKLAEQSRQLVAGSNISIQRNLEQLDEATRRLAAKSRARDASKEKAHMLLAGQGFDAEKLSRNLEAINLKATYEPIEAISDTDIRSYLRNQHDNMILAAIEEAKKETQTRFEDNFVARLEEDWEQVKSRWRDRHLLRISTAPPATSATPKPGGLFVHPDPLVTAAPLPLHTPAKPPQRTAMDTRMLQYARAVHSLNEQRKHGRPFAILRAFEEVAAAQSAAAVGRAGAAQTGGEVREEIVVDCYRVLGMAFGETDVDSRPGEAAFEAEYASGKCAPLKWRFVRGVRRFLEKQFQEFALSIIRANPQRAKLGGKPGGDNIAAAFWHAQFRSATDWPAEAGGEHDVIRGDDVPGGAVPLWPQLYYCLRFGDVDAALRVAARGEGVTGPTLVAALKEYATQGGQLSESTRERMVREYRGLQRTANGYRRAVYAVVARCDPRWSLKEVARTTQDYLWLKLAMLTDVDTTSEMAGDAGLRLSLDELQAEIVRWGPAHFSRQGSNPLLYFQVLLMSLQFESAVDYLLAASDSLHVDAVHFALGLYYYGCLRSLSPSEPPIEQLVEPPLPVTSGLLAVDKVDNRTYFDMAKLLRQYTRLFESTDPVEALEYYVVLRDRVGRIDAVRALVVNSREYDTLLGSILADGTRRQGALYRMQPLLDDVAVATITREAAEECVRTGRLDDAVDLYVLGDAHDKVVELLSQQLAAVIAQRNEALPERGRILDKAKKLAQAYMPAPAAEMSTGGVLAGRVRDVKQLHECQLLLQLAEFFDLYHAGSFRAALQRIEALNLLPLHTAERVDVASSDELTSKVQQYRQLGEGVQQNISEILLATMTILYRLYSTTKSTPRPSLPPTMGGMRAADVTAVLQELRAKARALVVFAGMIQHRGLPSDLSAQLVRMEVFMS